MNSIFKPDFNLVISGSRVIRDYGRVDTAITHALAHLSPLTAGKRLIVYTGGAIGVDTIASAICKRRKLVNIEILPMWKVDGKSAGFRRNERMMEDADALLAIWDGSSSGTEHTISLAERKGIPTIIARESYTTYLRF